MKYLKLSIFLFLVVFAFQVTACAQDEAVKPSMTNDQIAVYIRKALNVPANISITVKENPESKTVPGSFPIMIQFRSDRVNQDQEAWVTKGNFLVIGRTFDMSIDPYKKNLEKITLSNAPVTGAADAKVTIVEYSDFQCPYCSAAYVTVKDLLKVYEGKVKVVYKHLPLTNIHDWAQDAAAASVCVYQQNPQAFWSYSDYFFTNQKSITKETFGAKLQQFSTDSKLDYASLQKCIADPATAKKISADTAEASGLGLNSTPSFVVNGRTVVGALPEDQFKQVIDEALTSN
jgi:Protein-disulfide isomerase